MIYIVDSGIPFKKMKEKKIILEKKYAFENKKGKIKFIKNDKNINNFHGKTVFSIIKNMINDFNVIINIRILDKELSSTYLQLKSSLIFILENGLKGLVNLSMGVLNNDHTNELQELISQLLSKNIYIVCAASKVISYPSVLENVISVSDLNMYKNDRSEIKHKIDFVVDIDSYNYPFIPCSATSFAAPFVTAKAAEILQTKKIDNIFQLKKELCKYFMRWE